MNDNNLEALIEFTHDTDAHTRALAIAGLARIADPAGFNAVLVALFDPEIEVRIAAASALEVFNDARAIEPLLTTIETDDEHVAINALFALGSIEDESAHKQLFFQLDKLAGKEKLLASAISAFGQRAINKNCALYSDKKLQQKLINKLCEIYKVADTQVQASIIWTLGKFFPTQKSQKICESALQSQDEWCVKYAIESLRNFHNEQAKFSLEDFIKNTSASLDCLKLANLALQTFSD